MCTDIAITLSQIPTRDDLFKVGIGKTVNEILEYIVKEFSGPTGEPDYFAKAQNNMDYWKWYVELPFSVSEYAQHAVRDALTEKAFDLVHFNDYESFDSGFTRMSITVNKKG
ncbi:hypothetical protein MZD04_gp335 [Pseudomonas phage Psa21]|uniref:Uncharacterized protein n=1 Tax=Pseudomonas phage Psa21 TaxID=2530023 RepID=A0A481W4W7_9CAUD|nr:hypothetical protein MZD04_gp335 [Pseudomonas phage Psa21]QBJ02861.1 hypothetical protein PSA21_335 [Pseudomonas phage Psa21]